MLFNHNRGNKALQEINLEETSHTYDNSLYL